MVIFFNPEIADIQLKGIKMKPIAQNVLFFTSYLVTMMVLVGATYFVWETNIYPMIKLLFLLPLWYIGVLLTLSVDDQLRHE